MTKDELKAKYVATVVAAIDGDREHGWGVADSMKVIAMVMHELAEGTITVEEGTPFVESVVNPSAFRQKLEGPEEEAKEGTLKCLLNEPVKRKERKTALLNDLF
jgi:hypothetical protein